MWKYFNCGIGAILAGPKRVLDGMFHVRRMFGGRLKSAVQVSETFYSAMAHHPRIAIERIPNGTNLTRVTFKGVNVVGVAKRLGERGISMSAPQGSATITFGVNETWNRMTAADLIRAFEHALA